MADIRDVELLVLAEKAPDEKGKSWKVRLVQWIIDGKPKSIKLERRAFYVTPEGETRMGKAEGFTLSDLASMKNNWQKIQDLFANPPAYEAPPEEENKEVAW